MPQISVSTRTDHQLGLIASWEGTSKGEVVAQLLAKLPAAEAEQTDQVGTVPVHKVYQQHRIEGLFEPSAQTLTITTSPWSGEVFSKPSSAAISVVKRFSPGKNPNRNGWDFWRVTATDEPLQSLRLRG